MAFPPTAIKSMKPKAELQAAWAEFDMAQGGGPLATSVFVAEMSKKSLDRL